MSDFDAQAVLLAVFQRLRPAGFGLGVGELLAAYRAVEGGFGADSPQALREIARLLWCHSVESADELEEIFTEVLAEFDRPAPPPPVPTPLPAIEPIPPAPPPAPPLPPPPNPPPLPPAPVVVDPAPLPIPPPPPLPDVPSPTLQTYWPVSRRAMGYAWRHLRRLVKNGPPVVLDIAATVEHAAKQGFFLQARFDRRLQNQTHLILLIDQGGSMVPFHRFSRDLAETAADQHISQIRRLDVAYFHNVPSDHLFLDPHLTRLFPREALWHGIEDETYLAIVSDAGAARGLLRLERVRASLDFLALARQYTRHVVWLNPMPEPRWVGTTAQLIARLVPMFQLNGTGFNQAIASLRGLAQPSRL